MLRFGLLLAAGVFVLDQASKYWILNALQFSPPGCLESHFGYGTRAGWSRILGVLKQYGVKATMNCCAGAIAYSPWLAQEAVADGHEISSHAGDGSGRPT